MDFGLFTMFSTREGASQFHTFQEWFTLAQWLKTWASTPSGWGIPFPAAARCARLPARCCQRGGGRTKRIRVGLAVQVLPLANPLRVAEEAAIVDHISEVACSSGWAGARFWSPTRATT